MKHLFMFLYLNLVSVLFVFSTITVSSNQYKLKVVQPSKPEKAIDVSITVNNRNYNQITWSKQNNASIDHYNIYKRTTGSSLDWICIASIKYNSVNSYIDINSLSSQVSSSYLISIVDLCGNEYFSETPTSSILLSIKVNKGEDGENVMLKWNKYFGLKISNYKILIGNSVDKMYVIDSLTNEDTVYVKNGKSSENIYYQVEAIGNGNYKYDSKESTYQLYSNIVSTLYSSLNDTTIKERFFAYRNSDHDRIIAFLGDNDFGSYKAMLFDLNGQLVNEQTVPSQAFEIKGVKSKNQIYLLLVTNGKQTYSTKIIF